MGEFLSGDQSFEEVEQKTAARLSSEFRTYLGGKTPYGKSYSKELVRTAIAEFLWSHGASADTVKFFGKGRVLVSSSKAEIMAGNITALMDSGEFLKAGKNKNIDEAEKKQLEMIVAAVKRRIANLQSEISETPAENEEHLTRLQYESQLLQMLVTN